MSREEKDKKNKRAGILISGVAHVLILVLFIFLIAWRAPNPPLPEIGIELNFGTSNQGSGEEQPEPFTTPADTESEENAVETPLDEVVEDITEPIEDITEEVTEPIEETTDKVIENTEVQEEVPPVTDLATEAPVIEPEKKEEAKEEIIEENKKEEKKEVKEDVEKIPEIDKRSSYPGKSKSDPSKSNEGDDIDKVGDKGKEAGDIVADGYEGSPGGGEGGPSLQITGWTWDRVPDPKESTNEEGKVVIKFRIDDKGNVESAEVSSGTTVTRSLANIYRDEVSQVTFSPISSGTPQPFTDGFITFVINAK